MPGHMGHPLSLAHTMEPQVYCTSTVSSSSTCSPPRPQTLASGSAFIEHCQDSGTVAGSSYSDTSLHKPQFGLRINYYCLYLVFTKKFLKKLNGVAPAVTDQSLGIKLHPLTKSIYLLNPTLHSHTFIII